MTFTLVNKCKGLRIFQAPKLNAWVSPERREPQEMNLGPSLDRGGGLRSGLVLEHV